MRVWTGDLWISSPALYHCHSIATSGFSHLWQYQEFKSHAESLVVGLFWLDLWEIFFLPSLGFELGTSGSLVLHSTTAPCQWLLVSTSSQYQVINSCGDGLMVVLFWLDLWEIFFFPRAGVWNGDIWISSPALYHCTMVTFLFSPLTISGI